MLESEFSNLLNQSYSETMFYFDEVHTDTMLPPETFLDSC